VRGLERGGAQRGTSEWKWKWSVALRRRGWRRSFREVITQEMEMEDGLRNSRPLHAASPGLSVAQWWRGKDHSVAGQSLRLNPKDNPSPSETHETIAIDPTNLYQSTLE
jgi:hypothetical protein